VQNEAVVKHNEIVLAGRKRLTPSKGFIKAFELFELSRCRGCGRVLINPKSQERGFGPTCGLKFADRWNKAHPAFVEPEVQKRWTREEVNALLQKAGAKS